MKIYNYHPEYSHFLYESEADPSPLEPGVWLIPAHATDIEPPAPKKGKIALFQEGSWKLIKDLRGTYYNIQIPKDKIENYNPSESPQGYTLETPPEIEPGKKLTWNDGWVLEDLPPPPVLSIEEKLQILGITPEELKQLLGLP